MGKRAFSDEEFELMVKELLFTKPASFDTLLKIVEKTLKGWIRAKCSRSEILKKKDYDGEIYNDVCTKLVKNTVIDFLLKTAEPGQINRDPEGFGSWMFTVAKNVIIDTERRVARNTGRTVSLEEVDKGITDGTDTAGRILPFDISEKTEAIFARALEILLSSERQPYIIMTWLAMCDFIIKCNISRSESNHMIVKRFLNKKLFDIFDYLFNRSFFIRWFDLPEHSKDKLFNKLNEKADEKLYEGKKLGDLTYGELFGKKDPLAMISDWENRMNKLIIKVMKNDTPER